MIKLILGAFLIIVALAIAVVIDSKLFFYGKNEWGIHDKLPFKTMPQYWGYNRGNLGFVLVDEAEMTFIAKGSKYWSSDIEINEIIKYGFNKEKLVALVSDSLGKQYYVVCKKNPDVYSKQHLTINVVPKDSFINNEPIKWIDIKNVSTERMELAKNCLKIFLIFLISITIYYLLKNRKDATVVG